MRVNAISEIPTSRAKELLQKLEVQMAKDQADLDRKNAQEKERADRLAYIEGLSSTVTIILDMVRSINKSVKEVVCI